MTDISSLFSKRLLDEMIREKLIRVQRHPTAPLSIYNYTEKVQYDNLWNPVTLMCRGLIIDDDTRRVIARPFRKFFNYGQPHAPKLDLDSRVYAMDKVDGSLGILYPLGDTWAIATRGSFNSEQAKHATEVLRRKYPKFTCKPGVTPLFEIIYPKNRIVCDYGDQDDLVLLDVIDNETGTSLSPQWLRNWSGPVVKMLDLKTVAEVLAAPPRPGAEGIVMHVWGTGEKVKIKQDDYVALHRVITGTSARTLWQHIAVGLCEHLDVSDAVWGSIGVNPVHAAQIRAAGPDWLSTILKNTPDEFYVWVNSTVDSIIATMNKTRQEILGDFRMLFDTHHDRKSFAIAARNYPHTTALFMLLDSRDITPYLCKVSRPNVELPFRATVEL